MARCCECLNSDREIRDETKIENTTTANRRFYN